MDNENYFLKPIRLILSILLMIVQLILIIVTVFSLNKYISYVFGLSTIVAIIVSLNILRRKVKYSFKIPWVIFILAFPIPGLVIYFILGRRHVPKRIKRKAQEIENKESYHIPQNERIISRVHDEDFIKLVNMAYEFSGNSVFDNTSVNYFSVGESFFDSMILDMKNAKKFIFLEYYILKDGELYKEILDILIGKANEGLEIIILYDAMGSLFSLPKRFEKSMAKYNIRCASFNDFNKSVYDFLSFRDHRKITIIDGDIGYCGGFNIGDEYVNKEIRFGHWKDMGVKIQGDGVWNFTIMFLKMLELITGEEKQKLELYKPSVSYKYEKGLVVSYSDGPTNKNHPAEDIYRKIITSAKNYVYITTPYLILDNEFISDLTLAARSGVDVRIIIPHIPDKKIVFATSKSYYSELVLQGVKIYEYEPGFMHGKVFLSDDKISVVGTINLDARSLSWNYECATLFYDNDAIFDVKKDFLDTFEKSIEIKSKDIEESGFIERQVDSVLRLMSPLM